MKAIAAWVAVIGGGLWLGWQIGGRLEVRHLNRRALPSVPDGVCQPVRVIPS